MRRKVRFGLLIGTVVISLLYLTGCGTLETLINKDGSSGSFGNFIGGDNSGAVPVDSAAAASGDSLLVSLYLPDSSGKYLVKEQRSVPKTLSIARETVTEWLKGPAAGKTGSELAAVPTTTSLLDIALKGNLAVVDLSKDFLQPNAKVTPEVALYGLVDTLTQYPAIKQVQIRIEGKPLTTYGTINTTTLTANTSLIKSSALQAILPSLGGGSSSSSGSGSDSSGNGSSQPSADSPSSINLFADPSTST